MPERLVSTTCLGNLNDPSYELLLRRELGGVFEVDELLLDWDQADARTFVGVTELGRTIDVRLDTADGGRLADGDVLTIDRSGRVPVVVCRAPAQRRGLFGRSRPHGSDCARACVLGDRQHACAALPGRLGRAYRAHVYAGAAGFGPYASRRRGSSNLDRFARARCGPTLCVERGRCCREHGSGLYHR